MEKEFVVGSVVIATKGRDAFERFVIVGIIDKEYVYIANGKNRTVANPKKKKLKHIKPTGEILEGIAEKLNSQKKVFDKEISSALRVASQSE